MGIPRFLARMLMIAVEADSPTRRTIALGALVGLRLATPSALAQHHRPPDKIAPEEGLRKMLIEPEAERSPFPLVDAPEISLRESKRPEPGHDATRLAEKLRLTDVDPRKMYYGNGIPPSPSPPSGSRFMSRLFLDRTQDPLAREILRLADDARHRPLTVLWLFDRTRSTWDERPTVRRKLEGIFREIDGVQDDLRRMEEGRGLPGAGTARLTLSLTHLVARFGRSAELENATPTDNASVVLDAFERLTVDPSGVENTFRAIASVIREARQMAPAPARLLLVVATDESGDDDDALKDALQSALENDVPVYVIGRQALFGMTSVRLGSPAALADEAALPAVRRGPESADFEVLTWDGLQSRDDEQPSGFAPYALARLVRDTGGIYLLLPTEERQRAHPREKVYSIPLLRGYEPEYEPHDVYFARRERSPLRRTLHDAVEATRGFSVPLRFPHGQRPLPDSLVDAADSAERQRAGLVSLEAKLRTLGGARDAEPSKRWQANYDLVVGQLVACQITLREYRAAVLKLRNDVGATAGTARRTWDISRSHDRQAPEETTAAGYEEADRLLNRVMDRHPRTPWADLARTIRDRGLSVELRASSPDGAARQGPSDKY